MNNQQTTTHVRHQKKNQTARQAMVISGLKTIYRNTSSSDAIKRNLHSEPHIYFLDISIEDINEKYKKIHQIVESGRLRPKGTELFFVKTKKEHLIVSDRGIYEIKLENAGLHPKYRTHQQQQAAPRQYLQQKVVVDGPHTLKELEFNQKTVPILIDESYFKQQSPQQPPTHTGHQETHHISTEHHYIVRVIKTIRFHSNAPNAFVFVFDEKEENITDFYMTTENGLLPNHEKVNTSLKDDIHSFLFHFKLCS